MSQPDGYPAGSAQPGQAPVLDTKLSWTRLYADPQVITYGRQSIALDEVEWVSYWATHTATKRALFPTTHDGEYHFDVGKYPYNRAQKIAVNDLILGRPKNPPEFWTFLVNLSQRYLEPRLLAELVGRVRRGETVTVGGNIQVSQDSFACAELKLSPQPWESIIAESFDGMVWIYRAGAERALITVPLSKPNAGLIPALFATLTS